MNKKRQTNYATEQNRRKTKRDIKYEILHFLLTQKILLMRHISKKFSKLYEIFFFLENTASLDMEGPDEKTDKLIISIINYFFIRDINFL